MRYMCKIIELGVATILIAGDIALQGKDELILKAEKD